MEGELIPPDFFILPRFVMAFRFLLFALCLCFAVSESLCAESPDKLFEEQIRPVLATKCIKCHGSKKQEGKLRLDSRAAMLKGGESGPALVPGKPNESLMIEAMRYESYEMPPTGQLPENVVAPFVDWIAGNAVWPDHGEPIREVSGLITATDREWWAFQPLKKPTVPQASSDSWSHNEIDRFIVEQLNNKKLLPAPQATRTELARRLYFNLIGLPPTSEELDLFLQDETPQAWENLIDRLLADKRYGEHWGRYWLDVVRYAESDGWNQDAFRSNIYRYRDYVVNSFNADKPYPEFVKEQLAGDEIPNADAEAIVATGFLRLGIYEYNQRDAKSHWNDIINEMTDVAGDVFLGMGMACARCHDHKFDPLLQRDYFKLRAFFEPIIWKDDVPQPFATVEEEEAYNLQKKKWEKATADIRGEIDTLLKPYYDRKWASTVEKFPLDIQACFNTPYDKRTSWDEQMTYLIGRQFWDEAGGPLKSMKKEDQEKHEELKKKLAEFDDLKPKEPAKLMAATDFHGAISPTIIPDDPDKTPIKPGFLTVLSEVSTTAPTTIDSSTGRRTALAEWIAKPDNPLTTRVIVNRIWQQHFGKGIVPTASDFGHLGLPPTHPDLLDWLTVTFVEDGWSFKKLHKRILMSSTWQQASHHPQADEYQEKDPGEDLLWRFPVQRLSAEQIRDSILALSGELQQKVGGPSVGGTTPRRSLYIKQIRNTPDEFLHLFDVANGLKSVAERNMTTTPLQSLMMINGDWILGRAKKFAERLKKQKLESSAETVRHATRLAWGREPSSDELSKAVEFVGTPINDDRLTDFCHVLLNSSEFMYVE
jgi:hypothetical protein